MKSEKAILNKIEELEFLVFLNEKSLESEIDATEIEEIENEISCFKSKIEMLKWILK